MPCVERLWRPTARGMAVAALAVLTACAGGPSGPVGPAPQADGTPARGMPGGGLGAPTGPGGGIGSARAPGTHVVLPAPTPPRSWAEARLQAARRLMAANPDRVYTGQPPDILLAIPVLSIELNADGSVRHIAVLRYPSQARDTVELALQAVHRAAPFGDVSRLPKPWKFNETFLFNDQRRFKPMTLDRR